MKLSKHFRYFAFILLGLIGTVVLFFVSELIGFSHMNFVAFANPSYASWVYPVYFLISCLVFRKVFDISKKANYYIVATFVILLIWSYLIFVRRIVY